MWESIDTGRGRRSVRRGNEHKNRKRQGIGKDYLQGSRGGESKKRKVQRNWRGEKNAGKRGAKQRLSRELEERGNTQNQQRRRGVGSTIVSGPAIRRKQEKASYRGAKTEHQGTHGRKERWEKRRWDNTGKRPVGSLERGEAGVLALQKNGGNYWGRRQ